MVNLNGSDQRINRLNKPNLLCIQNILKLLPNRWRKFLAGWDRVGLGFDNVLIYVQRAIIPCFGPKFDPEQDIIAR